MTLRADGPEYVPLRVFRDERPPRPRLGPPHRPPGGAVEPERQRAHRGAADAALPGTRLVAETTWRRPTSGPVEERRDPSYTYQTKPLQTDGVTMAVLGLAALAALRGYLWVQGGGDVEGSPDGSGSHRRPGRRGLALAPHQEGPKARLRPPAHQGEGGPHRLRRRASDRRRPARNGRPEEGAGAGEEGAGAGGGGIPPLRPPRRGAVQGEPGPAHRARPVDAAPHRPRTLRQAQHPGRPRGGGPVAPAGGRGRDAPGWSGRERGC